MLAEGSNPTKEEAFVATMASTIACISRLLFGKCSHNVSWTGKPLSLNNVSIRYGKKVEMMASQSQSCDDEDALSHAAVPQKIGNEVVCHDKMEGLHINARRVYVVLIPYSCYEVVFQTHVDSCKLRSVMAISFISSLALVVKGAKVIAL